MAWDRFGRVAVDGKGKQVVQVDPLYYRPAEVETLLGDPAKAKAELGWSPRHTFDELVEEMVLHDLELARRQIAAESV